MSDAVRVTMRVTMHTMRYTRDESSRAADSQDSSFLACNAGFDCNGFIFLHKASGDIGARMYAVVDERDGNLKETRLAVSEERE